MHLARNRFVPSRSSRHRIAAIALYRALIKAACAVPLPASYTKTPAGDASTSSSSRSSSHPVAELVRKRFDRNKMDNSMRLVYYSMTAGYKVDMIPVPFLVP